MNCFVSYKALSKRKPERARPARADGREPSSRTISDHARLSFTARSEETSGDVRETLGERTMEGVLDGVILCL